MTGRREDEVSRELRGHLDLEIEDAQEAGLSPREARRAALRVLGNPTRVKEEVHDMSPWIQWERLAQDLRYGLRGFGRSPVFAATAVLSLALGIGANTAIFSVINAAMLRTLPVAQPEQLVVVANVKFGDFSFPDYLGLRDGAHVFSELMAASRSLRVVAGSGIDTEQAMAKIVSGNYFAGLGVRPFMGRVFTSADETEPVAVVSHSYWNRRFGGGALLDQRLQINGVAFTIVGVAPQDFFGEAPGESPDLWTSVALQTPAQRNEGGFTWLNLMGRLKPGTTLQQAQGDVTAVMTRRHPTSSPDDVAFRGVEVSAGARGMSGLRSRFADPLRVLMAIVGLVLLIACTNLGSLLLTRGAARQWEIGMRLAIGASRGRIVRQLMTESLLLAVAGGTLGLAFAIWGSQALLRMVSGDANGVPLDVGLDRRVLLFTAAVSIAAGVLFGLAPALRAVRRPSGAGLGMGARVMGRERRWSSRDAFLVLQLALSLILLAGSAMFVRTLRNLVTQDLGFRSEDVLQVSLVRERGYRPAVATLVPPLLERTMAIPGVTAASVAFNGTLSESGSGVNGLQIDGYTPRDAQDQRARANWIGPNYFRTAGIPLLTGREFTLADQGESQKVAVVNDTMAHHYFGDRAAVGQRFTFNKNEYEIVGVAKDAKYTDLREPTPRMVYFPVIQTGSGFNVLELRTSGQDPMSIIAAVRVAIKDVDPRLGVGDATTLVRHLDQKLSRERAVASLAGFFGGLTLLLASIGIYGTLAYTAARRTKEIGVRLALGSRRGALIWIMMRDVVVVLAIGVGLGTAAVLAGGRLVRSLLFGLQPNDLLTIGIAVSLLGGVALIAAYLPTSRASRLDPARVLRE